MMHQLNGPTSPSGADGFLNNSLKETSNSPSFDYYSARYDEMIARLKSDEKALLIDKVEKLPAKEENILRLCFALNNNTTHFSDEIFTNFNISYYALEAFRLGRIDEFQFGTIQLFWSIGQYHQDYDLMSVHSLFSKDGKYNSNILDLLFESLAIKRSNRHFLTKLQFIEFIEEMKNFPYSERCFFLVPDLQISSKPRTVSQELKKLKMTVFNRFGKMRIIPTVSMMQAFLNVKFGKQAMRINPVLGLSTLKQLRRYNKRDMAFPFPGVWLPENADNFPAPWYDITYHDFYHIFTASSSSRFGRKLMIKIAEISLEILGNQIDRNSPAGETLRAFCTVASDMEMGYQFSNALNCISEPPEKTILKEICMLAYKAFVNTRYKNFDFDTAVSFYETLAQKFICKRNDAKKTEIVENLREIDFIKSSPYQISKINFFVILADYVENKDRYKKSILPHIRCKIALEKMKEKFYQEFSKEKILYQYVLIKCGVEQEIVNTLSFQMKELLCDNAEAIGKLLIASITFQQFLELSSSRQKTILDKVDYIILLLHYGISWNECVELNFSEVSTESLQETKLLFEMNATLADIKALSRVIADISINTLYFLFQHGFSFKNTQMDADHLRYIWNNIQKIIALVDSGTDIYDAIKMD